MSAWKKVTVRNSFANLLWNKTDRNHPVSTLPIEAQILPVLKKLLREYTFLQTLINTKHCRYFPDRSVLPTLSNVFQGHLIVEL